jgi:hypothetical protein
MAHEAQAVFSPDTRCLTPLQRQETILSLPDHVLLQARPIFNLSSFTPQVLVSGFRSYQ